MKLSIVDTHTHTYKDYNIYKNYNNSLMCIAVTSTSQPVKVMNVFTM